MRIKPEKLSQTCSYWFCLFVCWFQKIDASQIEEFYGIPSDMQKNSESGYILFYQSREWSKRVCTRVRADHMFVCVYVCVYACTVLSNGCIAQHVCAEVKGVSPPVFPCTDLVLYPVEPPLWWCCPSSCVLSSLHRSTSKRVYNLLVALVSRQSGLNSSGRLTSGSMVHIWLLTGLSAHQQIGLWKGESVVMVYGKLLRHTVSLHVFIVYVDQSSVVL